MPDPKATVAEIVTFRLAAGADPAAFLTAAAAVEPMLRAGGDVIARTLSCDDDGLWTDHITCAGCTTPDGRMGRLHAGNRAAAAAAT